MPCLRQHASARVVQNGKHILLWSSHTKGACSISLLMKLACYTDILKCSGSAAWVAGIFSNERLPVNNKL